MADKPKRRGRGPGRDCLACTHPQSDAISAAIVAGKSAAAISRDYAGLSDDAVLRHREHVARKAVRAAERRGIRIEDDILDQIKGGQEATVRALVATEAAGDYQTMLQAVGHVRANVETMGKLLGRLRPDTQVNVLVTSPDWLSLRERIAAALEPFPEALGAVKAAIDGE